MNIFIFTKLRSVLNKLGLIRSGTGLSENFEYTPDPSTSFLQSAYSLKNADTVLDSVLGQATNEINVLGLRIDGLPVIDSEGRWVRDQSELIGPQGIQGIQGIIGPVGNNGLNGANGTNGLQGTTGAQGAVGTQGIQGTYGMQGVQGITGNQGLQGLQSAQGVQGFQGLSGNSVAVKGTVASPGNLPGSSLIGDIYIMSQSGTGYSMGDGYVFSAGNIWINIGQFRGSQGLQGLTGAGITGATGTQGATGIQGIQGRLGNQGIQGTQGPQSTQGTQGILGIQGSLGLQGIQGRQGIQGILGMQGVQGIQGIVGNVSYEIFISSTEPTSANGKNGDIWLTYHSF